MSDELLINVTPMECRVALIQNGTVNELFIERTAKRGLVGNIYKGKVVRVLPGMQAAFVDIGLSRTAFLHINDMIWPRSQPTPNVFELLQPGQILTVQVMKDMLGTKGARLSTDLSIPSRYLVLMPYGSHIGVSQRIESNEERERLRGIIETIQAEHKLPGSVIVRTAAEGVDEAAARTRLLQEFGLEIGAGLGALAGKVWRIGLMGHSSRPANVALCLSALGTVIKG